MPVDDVRKLINAIDNHRTQFNSPPFTPFISKRLRKLVGISEPTKPVDANKLIEVQQQIEDKLKQSNDELKQQLKDELKQQMKDEFKQQMKDMQELLNSLVGNLNANNDKIIE